MTAKTIASLAFALCFLVALRANTAVAADKQPLMTLQKIVSIADHDDNQIDNLFNGRQNPTFKKTMDYSRYLTKALLASMQREETRMLNETCQGRYHDGELCGIDYSPILCGQDTPIFTYRILNATTQQATIAAQHLDYPNHVTYYLIREQHRWKLDGVNCGNHGATFNVH